MHAAGGGCWRARTRARCVCSSDAPRPLPPAPRRRSGLESCCCSPRSRASLLATVCQMPGTAGCSRRRWVRACAHPMPPSRAPTHAPLALSTRQSRPLSLRRLHPQIEPRSHAERASSSSACNPSEPCQLRASSSHQSTTSGHDAWRGRGAAKRPPGPAEPARGPAVRAAGGRDGDHAPGALGVPAPTAVQLCAPDRGGQHRQVRCRGRPSLAQRRMQQRPRALTPLPLPCARSVHEATCSSRQLGARVAVKRVDWGSHEERRQVAKVRLAHDACVAWRRPRGSC